MTDLATTCDANSEHQPKQVRLYAAWEGKAGKHRLAMQNGRYFIGDTDFASIELDSEHQAICAILIVSDEKIILRCTSNKPIILIDNRRMNPGEQVVIADVLEFTAGAQTVRLSVANVSISGDHVDSRRFAETEVKHERHAEVFSEPYDIDHIKQYIARHLLDQLNLQNISLSSIDTPEVREVTRLKLRKIMADLRWPTELAARTATIEVEIFDEVMGLGPLEPLLADSTVTEIMVNRRNQIFVERQGKLSLSEASFSSDQTLINVIERIVSTIGRRIDKSSPIVDARLLDGSRVNAVIPPLSLKGPCLTIRRFSKKPISSQQLVAWGSMTQSMHDLLKILVEDHKNIVISGGTGSGKTTLLNALSSFIPEKERIVTVEDAAELQLQQEHVISLETRPANLEGKGAITIRDLVKNTLRMRPDRIIVGECRGGEALDMLQAMNTGHDGSMTTAHANAPEDMLRRLETMVLMAGMDLPLIAIRQQIASAVSIIVQQTRFKTGRRLVTAITWIRGLKNGMEYDAVDLFKRDRHGNVTLWEKALRSFCEQEEVVGDIDAVIESAYKEQAVNGDGP